MIAQYLLAALLGIHGIPQIGTLPKAAGEITACQIQFTSQQDVWLICNGPIGLFLSHDKGSIWTPVPLPAPPPLGTQIGGDLTARRPWIVIGNEIFTPIGSMQGWRQLCKIPQSPNHQLKDMAILDDTHSIVAIIQGEHSDLLLTSQDSGRNWRTQKIVAGMYTMARGGVKGHAYLMGSSHIMTSADRGKTWRPAHMEASGGQQGARDFNEGGQQPADSFFIFSRGWLVYNEGYLFRSEDYGQSWIELARPTQIWTEDNSPASYAIRFLTVDHGYQVGGDGKLRETQDGGLTWYVLDTGKEKIADLSCTDIITCYAIARGGQLLRIDSVGSRY